jgi:L-lactate utilization protein LutB
MTKNELLENIKTLEQVLGIFDEETFSSLSKEKKDVLVTHLDRLEHLKELDNLGINTEELKDKSLEDIKEVFEAIMEDVKEMPKPKIKEDAVDEDDDCNWLNAEVQLQNGYAIVKGKMFKSWDEAVKFLKKKKENCEGK